MRAQGPRKIWTVTAERRLGFKGSLVFRGLPSASICSPRTGQLPAAQTDVHVGGIRGCGGAAHRRVRVAVRLPRIIARLRWRVLWRSSLRGFLRGFALRRAADVIRHSDVPSCCSVGPCGRLPRPPCGGLVSWPAMESHHGAQMRCMEKDPACRVLAPAKNAKAPYAAGAKGGRGSRTRLHGFADRRLAAQPAHRRW